MRLETKLLQSVRGSSSTSGELNPPTPPDKSNTVVSSATISQIGPAVPHTMLYSLKFVFRYFAIHKTVYGIVYRELIVGVRLIRKCDVVVCF